MSTNILNLRDYKVVNVDETDHDYHVTAEVSNPPSSCSACGSDRLIGHGRTDQVIRDLPSHGKRVAIYVAPRRWRCQAWIINYFEHPVTNAYTESLNSLIRVMNRLGRGYSFEALRAKILFTEGAHKLTRVRPKFERRRGTGDMGYGAPKDAMGFYGVPPGYIGKVLFEVGHQHRTDGVEVNYGAHIPTLIALIESGQL